jgi:hypothetical protein
MKVHGLKHGNNIGNSWIWAPKAQSQIQKRKSEKMSVRFDKYATTAEIHQRSSMADAVKSGK